MVISFYLLVVSVNLLADKIPFAWEQSIPVNSLLENETSDALPYLEDLTRQVANEMALPEGMQVTLHYVNTDTVNAFATLGGHMVLHRGLLEKLRSEDELVRIAGIVAGSCAGDDGCGQRARRDEPTRRAGAGRRVKSSVLHPDCSADEGSSIGGGPLLGCRRS